MKATRPQFTPSAPKAAKSMTVAQLRAAITDANKPTSFKTVGGGTFLLYMSGDTNYYVASSLALLKILRKYGFDF